MNSQQPLKNNKVLVYLNSKHRVRGTKSDFMISFADLQIKKEKDEELYVFVVDCVINNSYYNIDNRNNKFRVDSTDLSIDPGNYNINQLVTAVKNAVQPTHSHLTFTYNNITSKLKIHHNSAHTNVINFNVPNSINEVLGFERESYILSSNVDLFSPNICNIGTDTCLYLHSNITNENLMSVPKQLEELESSTILSKIPVLVPAFSNAYFYAVNDLYRQKIPDENLDKLEFRVTNQDFKAIDLLNDFVITLCFERVKNESKELHNTLEELVKIQRLQFIKTE